VAANKDDVAIVGTEIVGLAHAYFAARSGRSVAGHFAKKERPAIRKL
jgi:hypothetical protein